jgi:hypothetical protein
LVKRQVQRDEAYVFADRAYDAPRDPQDRGGNRARPVLSVLQSIGIRLSAVPADLRAMNAPNHALHSLSM